MFVICSTFVKNKNVHKNLHVHKDMKITLHNSQFKMFYFFWNWNYYTERSNTDILVEGLDSGPSVIDLMPRHCDGNHAIVIAILPATGKTIQYSTLVIQLYRRLQRIL